MTNTRILGAGSAVKAQTRSEAIERISTLTRMTARGALMLDDLSKKEPDISVETQQEAEVLRARLRVLHAEIRGLVHQIEKNDFPTIRSDGATRMKILTDSEIYETIGGPEGEHHQYIWGKPLRRMRPEIEAAIVSGEITPAKGGWARADGVATGDGLIEHKRQVGPREITEFTLAPGEVRKRWMDPFRSPGHQVVVFNRGHYDQAQMLAMKEKFLRTGCAF